VEVEVAGAADTTVVVVNPGWGDSVQANKAGLMEIADLFVINKADRDGARQTRHDLEGMLDLSSSGSTGWRPTVIETVGTTGVGSGELWEAIGAHRRHLESTGDLAERRAQRLRTELALIVEQRLRARVEEQLDPASRAALDARVAGGELDPWAAADQLLAPLDP